MIIIFHTMQLNVKNREQPMSQCASNDSIVPTILYQRTFLFIFWRIHQTPTPLHPGSTFINGFFNVITYKIADFNSYHLRFYFWRSINKCGTGTQGVAFGGFVKACPSRRFCSVRSYIMMIRFLSSIGYHFMCHW